MLYMQDLKIKAEVTNLPPPFWVLVRLVHYMHSTRYVIMRLN